MKVSEHFPVTGYWLLYVFQEVTEVTAWLILQPPKVALRPVNLSKV